MLLTLTRPSFEYLPEYAAALRRDWSPDTTRTAAIGEELEKIEKDPVAFVASLDDPDARGGPVILADGSRVPRLPGFRRWLWDGEFCGHIGFRWQHGTPELPPTCLGHIGFGVVPWKRNRGYAKQYLKLLLPETRAQGLPYVELTTDPSNIASQKAILAIGGKLIERFTKTAANGGGACLRFRITL
jgi:predicted acetyltransferase